MLISRRRLTQCIVLDKVVDQSDCGAFVGNTKITDLVFADDAVIFAESLEVLVMALEALHDEAKPLGLEVSWLKTKVQVTNGGRMASPEPFGQETQHVQQQAVASGVLCPPPPPGSSWVTR
ncbi:hypothetical protein GWK47_040428 [Chionoecetes opilio]|uniref:Reverse transcriptase domain-containing protein n=1 Tax=Chionoecetes opilio TaxID=41210 RepID=A0A8J4YAQ5_CHIOP|nr:hypothetical protein GWK47_040428 [Chionoecetes opilio]